MAIIDDIRVRQTFSPDGYKFEVLEDELSGAFRRVSSDKTIVQQCYKNGWLVPDEVRERLGVDEIYFIQTEMHGYALEPGEEPPTTGDEKTIVEQLDAPGGFEQELTVSELQASIVGENEKPYVMFTLDPSSVFGTDQLSEYRVRILEGQKARVERFRKLNAGN